MFSTHDLGFCWVGEETGGGTEAAWRTTSVQNYHRCDERLMSVSYTDSRAYAWSVVHTLERTDAAACVRKRSNARGFDCFRTLLDELNDGSPACQRRVSGGCVLLPATCTPGSFVADSGVKSGRNGKGGVSAIGLRSHESI